MNIIEAIRPAAAHATKRTGTCNHCDKPILARSLCSMHYSRWWRDGGRDEDDTVVFDVWLCETSDLDFMARPGPHGHDVPITASWAKKNAYKLRRQLAVCARCTTRRECADLGAGESFGIWGGLLPHQLEGDREA